MSMITVEQARWGGGRDNGRGEEWLKFIIPEDEGIAAGRIMLLLSRKNVHVVVSIADKDVWGGKPRELGVAKHNGLVQMPEPHCDFRLSLRSTTGQLNWPLITQLKSAVTQGGKRLEDSTPFKLILIDTEEAEKRKQDKTPLVEEVEESDDYDDTDGPEEEDHSDAITI